MIPKVLILTGESEIARHSRFEKVFQPIGEFIEELSHLYTLLKERQISDSHPIRCSTWETTC